MIHSKESIYSGRGQKQQCPCCGFWTLEERGAYEICPVCFWEDDGVEEPDAVSGCNHGLTLRQGRHNYQEFGACECAMLVHVRKPQKEEK